MIAYSFQRRGRFPFVRNGPISRASVANLSRRLPLCGRQQVGRYVKNIVDPAGRPPRRTTRSSFGLRNDWAMVKSESAASCSSLPTLFRKRLLPKITGLHPRFTRTAVSLSPILRNSNLRWLNLDTVATVRATINPETNPATVPEQIASMSTQVTNTSHL